MRFRAPATKLKPFVNATASLAPGSGKRPQLECTRIDVLGNKAIFSATNLSETVRLAFSDDEMVGEDGSVYLPSVNLQRIVREAKREDVEISWNGKSQKALVRFGAVRVSLPIEPPDNLPNIPKFDAKLPFVTLKGSALAGTLARTVFAVQGNFMARALAGVSMKIKPGQLEAAATDGTAIAVVRTAIVNPSAITASAILPPISHKTVLWICADAEATVDLQFTEGSLRLRGPDGELTWRLLTGQFPDYEGHVPESLPMTVEVDRRKLLLLLDKARLLKITSLPEYVFTARRGELEMVASAGTDGTVCASMEIDWPWDELTMSLDPALLEVAVKAMKTDTISFGFEAGDQPVLLRESGADLENRYAVSPRFK